MTSNLKLSLPDTDPKMPELLPHALESLPICIQHCSCKDHWHVLWAALSGVGLMRTMYSQTAMLRSLLAEHWVPGGNVLIAGAADTGSFDVLTGLFDDPKTRFTLVEPCEAPIHLIAKRASETGRAITTIRARAHEVAADGPWDLVFIHNTLSFMNKETRLHLLSSLANSLSPRGVVTCAIRYRDPNIARDPAGAERWIEKMASSFARTFANHPDLLGPILQGLPAYAQSREHREQITPQPQTVIAECIQAGLRVLAYQELATPVLPDAAALPRLNEIKSEIFLLGRAR